MDKRKISIIVAAILALTAVALGRNYISTQEKKFVKEEKKGYVLFATRDIPAGTAIDETMFTIQAIPEKYIQPKIVTSPAALVGKVAIADILTGEQIMQTKLTIAVTKGTSIAATMAQGKRAITITLPLLSAVGGKVRPGDRVDVMGTFPYNQQVDGKAVTELVSVTLFQNVTILWVEGGIAAAERGKQQAPAPVAPELTFTLALSPREIAILTYALDQGGRLRLVLRPQLETAVEPVPPVEVNTLWRYVFSNLGQEFLSPRDEQSPVPVKQEKKPEPPPPPSLEIYRGTEKSNVLLK